MISMKDTSSLIQVLNITDAPVTLYKSTEVGSYLKNKRNLVVNALFMNRKKPKTFETFQMGKHTNFDGSNLNNQQEEKV